MGTQTNHEFDRRSMLLLGTAGAAAALLGGSPLALADDVKVQEIAPGVTLKTLREVDPMGPVPGYKKARLIEITWQPGAKFADPTPSKTVDICEIQNAPLYCEPQEIAAFTLQPGDVYFCPVGYVEFETNKSDKPSIMRIIELDPA